MFIIVSRARKQVNSPVTPALGFLMEMTQQDMARNQDKRKGSSLPFASRTLITLRGENSGRKQNKAKEGSTNMKSILKLLHLKSLAMWASQEASIPSLGAFFGHHLMTCGDPYPSLSPCQRCETILQPGHNCTVRIEPNRTRARHGGKKSSTSSQNNVIYWCHFCSHRNVKRGTPKDHMKEICPKVKPSLASKHTNPLPQKAANLTQRRSHKMKLKSVKQMR